ncbi:MAG: tetratricopeptide repeat protein [Cytophagales bacterium]|nr:tetratricopeptide repeat protein [Cytophagales bacterium]
MKGRILTAMVVILLGASSSLSAQCRELKWPEDRKKAEESVALWGDAVKQGNYKAAVPPFQWMLNNAPQWNTKLYIDGVDMYDNMAEKETNPVRKKALIDSMLMLYDMRVKNCGDEANVLNRKAYASYKYNIKTKEALPGLLALYDRVFEINGPKVSDGNIVAYMNVVKANQLSYKNLTDEQILNRYDAIMPVIDAKISKATKDGKSQDAQKLRETKDAVDGLLIGMVKVDCDFVKKNLAPKFERNPTDISIAKKIFKFMLEDKCTDDPLWLSAGEAVYKLSPEKDFGLLKALAGKHLSNGNYDKAESLLKEALSLDATAADKAEVYRYMGSLDARKNNYPGAREHFRQAAAANPSDKEAWEKIGDLYFNSFDNCAKKANQAEDRLVYIAAYDMYQKAGNAQQMARAKAQFPSKEDIFLLNWQTGSTQKIGCWIGESVTLRTRD